MLGSSPSVLREMLGVVSSLPIVCCCAWDGVYGEIVTQPLLPDSVCVLFSFVWCVGVTQLFSGFRSEGTVPQVAVGLVCLREEVSSGASYVVISNMNLEKAYEVFMNDKTGLKTLCPFCRNRQIVGGKSRIWSQAERLLNTFF